MIKFGQEVIIVKVKSYYFLQEKYGGKFIAKFDNRVIASAKDSKSLWNKVKDKIGNPKLSIEYIEPKGAICTYGIPSL